MYENVQYICIVNVKKKMQVSEQNLNWCFAYVVFMLKYLMNTMFISNISLYMQPCKYVRN